MGTFGFPSRQLFDTQSRCVREKCIGPSVAQNTRAFRMTTQKNSGQALAPLGKRGVSGMTPGAPPTGPFIRIELDGPPALTGSQTRSHTTNSVPLVRVLNGLRPDTSGPHGQPGGGCPHMGTSGYGWRTRASAPRTEQNFGHKRILSVVILRSAFFAGLRTCELAGGTDDACELHRSFVGSPRLRSGLRCLRMTSG